MQQNISKIYLQNIITIYIKFKFKTNKYFISFRIFIRNIHKNIVALHIALIVFSLEQGNTLFLNHTIDHYYLFYNFLNS